jgi:segregation and condensation protein A
MAAMLAEIKSRMLLPRSTEAEEEEDDPRAELIRRLQEYERFKAAAEGIDELPRVGRDVTVPRLDAPEARARKLLPDVSLEEVCCRWLRCCAAPTCSKATRLPARRCPPASA